MTRPASPRWFGWSLAAVMVAGLAARLIYVATVARYIALIGDSETYHLLARALADGDGYVRPRELLATGMHVPTAEFPPLHPLVLALADLVGITSPTGHRVVGSLIGTGTVLLIGLLGRRIAGPRAGVLAAGIAALSPVLIGNDTSLQAEGLFMCLLAGSLLAIHVAMTGRPRPVQLVLVGLLLGLTALTRSEAVLLVPVAAVLIGWPRRTTGGQPATRARPLASVARSLGLVALGAAVLLGAWAVRSSVELGGVVLTSTNSGTLLAGSNCDPVYHGPQKGLWRLDCVSAVDITGVEHDELGRTRRWISAGTIYARDHLGEVPGVAVVRALRTWGLWDPPGQVAIETLEGRNRDWHTFAHRAHLVVLALAVGGFVVLGRWHQRRDLALLLAPVLLSVLVSMASWGNTRFRAGADVALVVAAALAVEAVLRRWWPLSAAPEPAPAPPVPGPELAPNRPEA